MGTVNKITGTLATAINKVSGVAITGVSKVIGQLIALFTDDNAVAKSITTGTGQAVYIKDSDGNYNFDHNDACTVSFWIKPGWTTSLNTNTHLWSSSDVGAANANNNTYRFWYDERNNRLNAEWRTDASNKKSNFWVFHANYGDYAAAYAAAGLGATYWLSTNRGNTGDDDYTLITVTRGTSNSGASSNLKLYWNATDCGVGHYASGGGAGTPTMGTGDKQIALGSSSWTFHKCGDTNETKFNGVTIWNAVLTAGEVDELYNDGTPMNVSDHSAAGDSLIGWWNFESDGSNEVSGAPAFDEINGNSNIEAK